MTTWIKKIFVENSTDYTALVGNNTELGVEEGIVKAGEAKTKAENAEAHAKSLERGIRIVAAPSTSATEAERATANTAAIQTAINEGAGTIQLWAGTYEVNLLETKSNVTIEGAGRDATILKLRNGANTDLMHSEGWETLHVSRAEGGIQNGGFRNLTIDGNKTNNTTPCVERTKADGVTKASSKVMTSATAAFVAGDKGAKVTGTNIAANTYIESVTSSTEVQLSKNASGAGTGQSFTLAPASGLVSINGKQFALENFIIQNAAGNALWCEWNGASGLEMESWVTNFKIRQAVKTGIVWGGPHDSMLAFGDIAESLGEAGVKVVGLGSATNFIGLHVWGPQEYAWLIETSGNKLIDCQGEGSSKANLWLKANANQIIGGGFFGNAGVEESPVGMKIKSEGSYINTVISWQYTHAIEFEALGDLENTWLLEVVPYSGGANGQKNTEAEIVKGGYGEFSGSSFTQIWVKGLVSGATAPPMYLRYPNIGGSGGKMAFFGTGPVGQPKTTGTVIGVENLQTAAGNTKANIEEVVKVDLEKATFTGNNGTTKYTLSDVVLALKQLGFLEK